MVLIRIELDVAPNELQFAAELFSVLRSLTEGNRPATSAPAEAPGSLYQAATTFANRPQLFASALAALPASGDREEALAQILAVVTTDTAVAEAATELVDAMTPYVFGPQATLASIDSCMYIISRLPDNSVDSPKNGARQRLVSIISQSLTENRPVDTDRQQIIQHANVMTAMVNFDLVKFVGSLKLANKLCNSPLMQAAGVTLTAKLAERCHAKFHTDLAPEASVELTALRQQLAAISTPAFEYDKRYIAQALNWPDIQRGPGPAASAAMSATSAVSFHAPPAPVAFHAPPAPAGGGATGLLGVLSGGRDPSSAVFSVATTMIQNRFLVASGDSKGGIVFHDASKLTVEHTHALPPSYQCTSLDFCRPKAPDVMLALGMPTSSGVAIMQCLKLDSVTDKWNLVGQFQRDSMVYLKFLWNSPGMFNFVVSQANSHSIAVFDMNQGGANGFSDLAPVAQLSGHQSSITCLAVIPDKPHQFVSCSEDNSVLMWDVRQLNHVAQIGRMDPATGIMGASSTGVMSVDAFGHQIVTGDGAGVVAFWDARMAGTSTQAPLRQVALAANNVAARLACGPGGARLAVSSWAGLFLLDTTSPDSSLMHLSGTGFAPDVCWNDRTGVLCAAGAEGEPGHSAVVELFRA